MQSRVWVNAPSYGCNKWLFMSSISCCIDRACGEVKSSLVSVYINGLSSPNVCGRVMCFNCDSPCMHVALYQCLSAYMCMWPVFLDT